MSLETIVRSARERGASDVHLEPGLPVTLRVRGELVPGGEAPSGDALASWARELLGSELWQELVTRGSADVSRVLGGARCRINVLRTTRGVGFALRLLASSRVTLERLNLHPELARLTRPSRGLVLITGSTGSGKTSTLAALLQEVNLREARHIITLESPIEYVLTPRLSLIRQREVGRDTPSFAQGLVDALREDPDVLMVGELRENDVMRLTLGAAETGHLVLATMHSGTIAEALQRIAASFAPELQQAVCAQLAESLIGIVAQRLVWHDRAGRPVPECEVLMASTPAKALIRQGQFFKLNSVIETGAADGSWTFARYRDWLDARTHWHDAAAIEAPEARHEAPRAAPVPPVQSGAPKKKSVPAPEPEPADPNGRLVIQPEDDDPEQVLRELEHGEG